MFPEVSEHRATIVQIINELAAGSESAILPFSRLHIRKGLQLVN